MALEALWPLLHLPKNYLDAHGPMSRSSHGPMENDQWRLISGMRFGGGALEPAVKPCETSPHCPGTPHWPTHLSLT